MSDARQMEILHQRSVWGAVWHTHISAGLQYRPGYSGTVLAGLGIAAPSGELAEPMAARYALIGLGGVKETGTRPYPVRHDADDIAPREILPWRILPIEEDIQALEGFYLRKERVLEGKHYALYYAKELSKPSRVVSSVVDMTNNNNLGSLTPDPRKGSDRDTLDPVAKDLNDRSVDVARYAVTSAPLAFRIDEEDERHLRLAAGLLKQDASRSAISEVFICMGEQRHVSRIDQDFGKIDYKELTHVQPMLMLSFSPVTKMELHADLGVTEPILLQRR